MKKYFLMFVFILLTLFTLPTEAKTKSEKILPKPSFSYIEYDYNCSTVKIKTKKNYRYFYSFKNKKPSPVKDKSYKYRKKQGIKIYQNTPLYVRGIYKGKFTKVKKKNITVKRYEHKDPVLLIEPNIDKKNTGTIVLDNRIINLGDSVHLLREQWGRPDRIDYVHETFKASNDKYVRYVYNSTQDIIIFDVYKGIVAGWISLSPNAETNGISCSDSIYSIENKMDREYDTQVINNITFFDSANYYNKSDSCFEEEVISFWIDNQKGNKMYNKIFAIRVSADPDTFLENFVSPPAPTGSFPLYCEALESLDITNGFRILHGVHPLIWDETISAYKCAQEHNLSMIKNNYFDHEDPFLGGVFERMYRTFSIDFGTYGENIARGPNCDMYTLMKYLYLSIPHKVNLLEEDFTHYGADISISTATHDYDTNVYLGQNFFSVIKE